MNGNPNQGHGPSQGQTGVPAQQRSLPLFRPEQMRALPGNFTPEEKLKWENGLSQLYKAINDNPPESQQHQDAKKKVRDFSMTLQKKIQSLTRPQSVPNQAQHSFQGSNIQGQSDGASQGQNIQQTKPPQVQSNKPSEQMMNHIQNFPYVLPPQLAQGTPDAMKWLQEQKSKYGKALIAMESATGHLRSIEAMQKERTEQGKSFSQEEMKELVIKKQGFQKQYADAKRYVENFREAHSQGASQQQTVPNAAPVPTRPTLNLSQQAPNVAQQNTQAVSAAFEAARNQHLNGGRPQMPPNDPMLSGQGSNTNIKLEPGSSQPQLNTALTSAPHMQQRPPQNSPQTGLPPNHVAGAPRPYTQQEAMAQAKRSYSSQQTSGTPSVMASTSQQTPNIAREAASISTNKMPIPKQLPPSAVGTPQPVIMQPARPTMSGGPNASGSGLLGQPVIQKTPAFNPEGEGERVMNKKKLDELVRQVTGGGEGLDNNEGLTPEVEDSILSVADEFVDQVITAACKCAKARGSKTLEIRDIQLILERNYNIRIPGYASDEIRTVRKFQPAAGWISKMSAIQAAKVTGGKGDL